MTNEKHCPKTLSQWEFDYGLFTNLPRAFVPHDFSASSLKLKRGILPLLYPNLKTTCLIKLKFFLWIKLLENLLIAKYLISVAAPLIINKWHNLCAIIIFDSSGLTRLILHLVFCFFFFLVLFTAIKIVVFKVNTYVYPLGMLRSNFS